MLNRTYSNVYQPRQPTKSFRTENQLVQLRKSFSSSYSTNTAIEIARFCIEYINNERFILNENSFVGGGIGALLRPANGLANPNTPSALPSLILDIRGLLDSLLAVDASAYNRLLHDYDTQPQIILGAAFSSLRSMSSSLWNEVYDDILLTADMATDDYNQTKQSICSWLVSLSPPQFDMTKSFFKFLNRYLTAKLKMTNTTNATDLAVAVSGYICKPGKSAFMSIRHMEDLRRIRPVVAFIIERFPDIFTKDLKPIPRPINTSESQNIQPNRDHSEVSTTSPIMDMKASPSSPTNSRKSVLPTLLTTSDSLSRESSASTTLSFNLGYSITEDTSPPVSQDMRSLASLNITRWEMKILESIVQHISTSCLKRHADYLKKNQMLQSPFLGSMQSPTDSPIDYFSDNDDVVLKTYSKELSVSAGVYSYRTSSALSPTGLDSPTNAFNNMGLGNDSYGSGYQIRHGNAFENSPRFQDAKKWTKRREQGLRRRMISECKAVRNQIMQFEQEWIRKYGRDPKSSDRGNMQPVYASYRDMKRTIRDVSAIDIQRFVRSYMVRVRLRKANLNLSFRNDTSNMFNNNSSNNSKDSKLSKSPFNTSSSSSINLNKVKPSSGYNELMIRYRELQSQKKEIKRQLKRFDEDFAITNGRQPKKADKEVMRPMYQNYHDIKAKVDDLKKLIESQNGGIPIDDSKDDDDEKIEKRSPGKNRIMENNADKVFMRSRSDGSIDSQRTEDSVLTSQSLPQVSTLENDRLSSLLEEKKNLHAYLKSYERDFNKTHGRPVMKEEDIQPVANEYQRYKELKQLIKDCKASILSSSAGIGGGSINVAILLVIGHLPLETSIILSFCALCGNLISQIAINTFKSHPYNSARPLIYWELILVLLPAQLGGANIGVLLQRIFPESMIMILAIATLAYAFTITTQKFRQLYRFETLDHEYTSRIGTLSSSNRALGIMTYSDNDDTDYDEFEALMNEDFDKINENERKHVDGSEKIPNINVKHLHNQHGLSGLSTYHLQYRFPYLIVQIIISIWIVYFSFYIILRQQPLCSMGYFTMLIGIFPFLIFEVLWGIRYVKWYQRSDQYISCKGDINFESSPILTYSISSFGIGILCTLLGLGGGELMGPLILSMKVLPQISTATTSVMSLLNSASSAIFYISRGKVPIDHGLVSFIVGSIAGIIGRILAFYQSVGTGGRPSILIFCLVLILGISFIMNIYNLITVPRHWSFHSLCD